MPKKKAAARSTSSADASPHPRALSVPSALAVCHKLVDRHNKASNQLGLGLEFNGSPTVFFHESLSLATLQAQAATQGTGIGETRKRRQQLVKHAQGLLEALAPPCADASDRALSRRRRLLLCSFIQQVLQELGLHNDLRGLVLKHYKAARTQPKRCPGELDPISTLCSSLGLYGLMVSCTREQLEAETVRNLLSTHSRCLGTVAAHAGWAGSSRLCAQAAAKSSCIFSCFTAQHSPLRQGTAWSSWWRLPCYKWFIAA